MAPTISSLSFQYLSMEKLLTHQLSSLQATHESVEDYNINIIDLIIQWQLFSIITLQAQIFESMNYYQHILTKAHQSSVLHNKWKVHYWYHLPEFSSCSYTRISSKKMLEGCSPIRHDWRMVLKNWISCTFNPGNTQSTHSGCRIITERSQREEIRVTRNGV